MATSDSNAQLISYTTLDTAPDKSTVGTGTISSVGKIVSGVNTLFGTEVKEYDWLFNGVDEVRQIKSISSPTLLYLDKSFTSNIGAGTTPKYTVASNWQEIGFADATNPQAGGGKVDGVTLTAGEYNTYEGNLNTGFVVEPFVVDGSTGTIHISRFTKGNS